MAGIHPRRRRRKKKKALIAAVEQRAQSALSEDPSVKADGRAATPLDTARIVTRFKQLKQAGALG